MSEITLTDASQYIAVITNILSFILSTLLVLTLIFYWVRIPRRYWLITLHVGNMIIQAASIVVVFFITIYSRHCEVNIIYNAFCVVEMVGTPCLILGISSLSMPSNHINL